MTLDAGPTGHRGDNLTGPYNLARPTLDDAYAALLRLHGSNTDFIWRQLLTGAGLTGRETDPGSFDRMVDCMRAADPIIALCARSLAIRAATFTRLSAVHTLIHNAE